MRNMEEVFVRMEEDRVALIASGGISLEVALAEVGAGWHPLVRSVFEMRDRCNLNHENRPPFTTRRLCTVILQVKQKFGELCIYAHSDESPKGIPAMDSANGTIFEVIETAERKSRRMCEICGGPGRIAWQQDAGMKCLCLNHDDPHHRSQFLDFGNGTYLRTHAAGTCVGEYCSVHNPSDHSMKYFPQSWRSDRGLMERICPHGVGHPDPDHLAFVRQTRGDKAASIEAIHGCDGCCA